MTKQNCFLLTVVASAVGIIALAGCATKPEATTPAATANTQKATASAPAHGTMTAGARSKKHTP